MAKRVLCLTVCFHIDIRHMIITTINALIAYDNSCLFASMPIEELVHFPALN